MEQDIAMRRVFGAVGGPGARRGQAGSDAPGPDLA